MTDQWEGWKFTGGYSAERDTFVSEGDLFNALEAEFSRTGRPEYYIRRKRNLDFHLTTEINRSDVKSLLWKRIKLDNGRNVWKLEK